MAVVVGCISSATPRYVTFVGVGILIACAIYISYRDGSGMAP